MWKGYLRLGDTEIGNNARAYGYATTADCPLDWFRDDGGPGLVEALGDSPYEISNITDAPWYDPRDSASSRFYGARVISADLTGSTRVGGYTEGITNGGVATATRFAGRQVRVRVWLSGAGLDSIEYGQAWLDSALAGGSCGMHAGDCGETDLTFFLAEPEPQGLGESQDDYQDRIVGLLRHMHDVTCISGPLPINTFPSSDGIHWGREVEFTFYVEVPWIYSETRSITLQPTLPVVVQDIPYNLVTRPSAELPGAPVVVAENKSDNPSVEVDAAGWSQTVAVPSPTGLTIAGARSDDIAAAGSWSYRVRVSGDGATSGSGASAVITSHAPTIPVALAPVGSRFSASIWGAALILGGPTASRIRRMRGIVTFIGAAASTTVVLTPAEVTAGVALQGSVFSARSLRVPAGTTGIRVSVEYTFDWGSSSNPDLNSDIRLYADAHAVTVP